MIRRMNNEESKFAEAPSSHRASKLLRNIGAVVVGKMLEITDRFFDAVGIPNESDTLVNTKNND